MARIPGSARVEGAARTAGVPGSAAIMPQGNTAVSRAVIFWAVAVGVLFVFHVGGARLG